MGAWFLFAWPQRGHAVLPHLATWVAIGATWCLADAVPRAVLPPAVLALGVAHAALLVYQHARGSRRKGSRPAGWLGQSTVSAGYLALVLPFTPWWLVVVLASGLWLAHSWLAFLALIAAAGVLYPTSLAVALPGVVGFALALRARTVRLWLARWTPRGGTTKTVDERLRAWWIAAYWLTRERRWVLGAGPGTMTLAMRRWSARYRLGTAMGDLHCEPLQHAYEYGVLGVCAVVLFAVRLAPHLTLGDPWSAAVIAGAVLSLASLPLRVAPVGVTWLLICQGVTR